MNGPALSKNYLIASVLVHVAIVLGINYMINRNATSNKNFVIFGAHSRYTTKALYKSSTVPFTGTPSKKGSGKKGKKGKGSKKFAKKITKKSTAKKTKPRPASKAALRKSTPQLHMPSPTAMVEDTVKATSRRRKLKKFKAVAPLPEIDQSPEQDAIQEPPSIQQDTAVNTETTDLAHQTEDTSHNEENSAANDDDDSDAIHVGIVDSSDPVTRYHQRIMNEEFHRLWQPPVGVRKGTECHVRMTFSKDGIITSIEFTKRSQVPIYDLSVLRLKLAKMNIPSIFHGTSRTVVFRQ